MQGSRADSVAASVLLELLGTIEATIPGALSGEDPDQLHDLRMAVRSTRTLLHGMPGVFPPEALERFRADFKWVQQLTNPTRDFDVLLLVLDGVGDGLPGDAGPVRGSLSKRRTAERRVMRRGLTSARAKKLLSQWRALLAALPEMDTSDRPDAKRPVKKLAGVRVAARYRKLVRLGLAAEQDPAPERFHELRKRAKDLRYFLNFFADLFPGSAVKPLRSDLKSLHAVLGGFHDRAVQQQILLETADELLASGSGAAPMLAIGALLERMSLAQADADHEFDKCFAQFSSKKRRAMVKSVFG